jgi:peptidoglycan/LPS O-acetylase OafA/YrhL
LRILVAGHQAVAVFFVLSGFVLYASLTGTRLVPFASFVARRFLRLYPPVAAAILCSAAMYVLVHPQVLPGASDWVNRASWSAYPDAHVLAGYLLLGGARYQSLDNPIWSLIVELRMTLVFPLIACGIAARPLLTLVLALATSAACVAANGTDAVEGIPDVTATGQYVLLFTAGAYMAHQASRIARVVRGASPPLVLGLSLVLITQDAV